MRSVVDYPSKHSTYIIGKSRTNQIYYSVYSLLCTLYNVWSSAASVRRPSFFVITDSLHLGYYHIEMVLCFPSPARTFSYQILYQALPSFIQFF